MLFTVLLWGCVEKRIMPKSPTDPMVYDIGLEYTLDFESEDIPDERHVWDIDIRLTLLETHRDDSLSLQLDFLDVQTLNSGSKQVHPLTNQQLVVRCFPWGELLLVEGWENVSYLEDVQWLDFVFGALFPNPPVRASQQWKSRLLPWPYFLNPEAHSKQIVAADWTQPEAHTWQYQGTYYGKRGVTPLFDGVSKGTMTATSPWVQSHELEWTRSINRPIGVEQQISGKVVQR